LFDYYPRKESHGTVNLEGRPTMRVAVAYDHRGRKGVECVKTTIEQQGHECIDLGSLVLYS
jgi:hypothetical protein